MARAARWTHAAAVMASSLLLASCAAAQTARRADDGWRDPAPHRVSFVRVAPGVRLEVLDFGGTGDPVVLLAGIGNSAHAWDDFAPALAAQHRVVAITRRGFGASSDPENGYGLDTLARDVIAVLDSMRLPRVHLVGHSFAGQEMTKIARRYPGRVARLVYLDAAFDYVAVDSIDRLIFPDGYDWPARPVPSARDTATIGAYVRFVHTTRGIPIPEADIRSRYFNDGVVEEIAPPYVKIGAGSFDRQSWQTLQQPALAVFAVYDSVSQLEPWARTTGRARRQMQAVLDQRRRSDELLRRDFERAPRGRSLVVHGGHHWVFVSHRDLVLRAVLEFLR